MSSEATLALCIGRFGQQYAQEHQPPAQVLRTLWRLRHCRTEAMGSRLEACQECGHQREAFNSCRDRHCPVCQGASRLEWAARRKEELLPATYFHVVFTLPDCLNAMAMAHRAEAFSSLFQAAWQTLQLFALKQGVRLGATAVLHTWGSALTFHPHLHCIVTGGGADIKTGQWKSLPWIGRKRDGAKPFLFPVRALSTVFRAKFVESFSAKLPLGPALREQCFDADWCVYAKSPASGPEKVVEYLARYAYRIAISNGRIKRVGQQAVTFAYKDYRAGGAMRLMTLQGVEFIRRYAMHILPGGFMRIRHYGILAACNRAKLARLQASMGAQPLPARRPRLSAKEALALRGIAPSKCPECGCAQWRVLRIRSPAA